MAPGGNRRSTRQPKQQKEEKQAQSQPIPATQQSTTAGTARAVVAPSHRSGAASLQSDLILLEDQQIEASLRADRWQEGMTLTNEPLQQPQLREAILKLKGPFTTQPLTTGANDQMIRFARQEKEKSSFGFKSLTMTSTRPDSIAIVLLWSTIARLCLHCAELQASIPPKGGRLCPSRSKAA
jgi:hypothetical protein